MSITMTEEKLAERKCTACEKGEALEGDAVLKLMKELGNDWLLIEERQLEKVFKFNNFKEALAFVNRVGEFAESIGHHPDIYLTWGKVKITVWTHKINGLQENDFIFAANADKLYSP
jgi:4a-hydroxytetrahydrobiopterin dehydratase